MRSSRPRYQLPSKTSVTKSTAQVNTGWMEAVLTSEDHNLPVSDDRSDVSSNYTDSSSANYSMSSSYQDGSHRDDGENGSGSIQGLNASNRAFSGTNTSSADQGSSSPISRQSLCVHILTQGYVSSFVDFFYLTHKAQGDTAAPTLPDSRLFTVKQHLINAEKAYRKQDTLRILESYEKLAEDFQVHNDHKTANFFYEKCLEIAESTGNLGQQCVMNGNLGVIQDALGDMPLAVRFLERRLHLAQEIKDEKQISYSNRLLLDVYRRYAESFERSGDTVNAIEYYEKCRQVYLFQPFKITLSYPFPLPPSHFIDVAISASFAYSA